MRLSVDRSAEVEGLRIDLLETNQGIFCTGNAQPTAAGAALAGNTRAGTQRRMPNRIVVEGHTDARPFRNAGPSNGYGNWELAMDRTNAARRLLLAAGVRPAQLIELRAFADHKLLNEKTPYDARNRRVSVVVKLYMTIQE